MSEFFRTVMGKIFFESTLPKLVKEVGRLADAQEKHNELIEKQQTIIAEDMKREADRDKFLYDETVSTEWVLNTLAGLSFPSSGSAHDFIKSLVEKEKGERTK